MNVFRENIGLVVLALIIALGIKAYVWFIDPMIKMDFMIAVQPKNLQSGLSVSSIVPNWVEVTVTGPKSRVEKFTERDFTGIADCTGIDAEGHFEVKVKLLQSSFKGIKYSVSPDTVYMVIGKFEKKFINPTLQEVGVSKIGRTISKIEGLPDSVQVSGGAKFLEEIDKVIYQINMEHQEDSWTEDVKFFAIDKDSRVIENVSIDPPTTTITVYLRENKVKKNVPVVLRWRGTPAADYAVLSQKVTPQQVEVSGEPSVISSISFVETETISLTEAKSDVSRDISLITPHAGVSIEPSKVKAEVEISRVLSRREITDIPIELRKKRGGFNYSIEPQTTSVRVQGPVQKLSSLDITLIKPSIDVSLYEEGTYTLILDAPGLPSEVTLVNMNPKEIKLTVTASRVDSER